ncbi:cytochrome P450 [Hypoxylon crocopeplum]|nr:cytochrome P450 [Hypoxylon crocopeplum]
MAFQNVFAQAQHYVDLHSTLTVSTLFILAGAVSLLLLYRAALPKPFPGIPYNEASSRNLFGDVPAMMSHIANDDGTFISYLVSSLQNLDAPLVQVFIKPFSKPLLILSDYREAHDLMTRRLREWDRSTSSGDLVRGLGKHHHVHLKTNAQWRFQRRLMQDLMTPRFLNNVAGPAIHQNVCTLVDLWKVKSRIADGRPWPAAEDVDNVALDAVMVFAFGELFGQKHSATRPNLGAVEAMDAAAIASLRNSGTMDEPVHFPEGKVDDLLRATLELVATVGEVQGSPLPDLKWAYVNSKPRIRRAYKIKEEYVKVEIRDALSRMKGTEDEFVKSAVDHMVFREKVLAEKDGRAPDYFSRVMMDEVFGFVVVGNDTSSTTISWSLKYLAENIPAQTKLRKALEAAFPTAAMEGRNPTIQEMTGAQVHYLDAAIEETLRCSATAPVVDRQAVVDTEILGYRVPKGTVVTCLVAGPSMMSSPFEIDEARRSEGYLSAKEKDRDSQIQRNWDPADMAFFNPDRWIVGGEFDVAAGPQLAFGLGTRQCFGKRLAHLEMRIVMTLIVWNFELLPCPPALSSHKPLLIMTNRPKDCYVRLREVRRERKDVQ